MKFFMKIVLIALILIIHVHSQEKLSNSVFSTGGSSSTNSAFKLKSTLGEIIVGKGFNSEDNINMGFWYINKNSITGVKDNVDNQPKVFSLSQNYPNPFNPSTTIKYSLKEESRVQIKVFNSIGQEVATLVNNKKPAGEHSLIFNANDLASGVYLYRIQAGSFIQSKKMILVK